MDAGDSSSTSSSTSSPPASPTDDHQHHHHRGLPLLKSQSQTTTKRRAGRKKFRETRHPVYRGVRARGGGGGSNRRWVCEVREPQAQARIWLGTYPTPEMAARAHDVAAIALRGAAQAADMLNFPDSAHALPRPRTAAPEDIRCAAAQAAELYRPSSSSSSSASSGELLQQGQHGGGRSRTTIITPPPPISLPPSASACCWTTGSRGDDDTATATPPCCCCDGFVDEDAIFDMPGLIDDMARGMLLTPPAIMARGLQYWGSLHDDDDDDDSSHVDCTLWMVD